MPIGKGAFGKIYLGRREGKTFALKLIDLEKIKRETNLKVKEIRERLVHSEPRLMMQCNSPNVLKCFEIIENSSLQILVLEYCNGKTLQQLIDENRHLKEEDAVKILRQIIIGIAVAYILVRNSTATALFTVTLNPRILWSTRANIKL